MMHILGQGEGEKMWYKNVHNALVKIWKKEFYKYSNDPQQNHTTSTTWRNSLIRIKDLDSNMVDTKIKTQHDGTQSCLLKLTIHPTIDINFLTWNHYGTSSNCFMPLIRDTSREYSISLVFLLDSYASMDKVTCIPGLGFEENIIEKARSQSKEYLVSLEII